MGLPHDADIEIPDSKEATETNNQPDERGTNNQEELETIANDSQCKSTRTRTNTNLWSRSDDYLKTVKIAKKKSGYQTEDDQLTSPSTIKFCDYVFPISVDPDRQNCLLGNTINLLDYLDHLDDSLSRGINKVILASGSMTDIKQILRRH